MALFNLFGKKADTLSDAQKEQILNKAKDLINKGRYAAAWDTLAGDGKFNADKIWIDYNADTVISLIEECEEEMESAEFIGRYNPKGRWAKAVNDVYLLYAKNCYAKGNCKGAWSHLANGGMVYFEKRWQGYRYDEAKALLRDCEMAMSKEDYDKICKEAASHKTQTLMQSEGNSAPQTATTAAQKTEPSPKAEQPKQTAFSAARAAYEKENAAKAEYQKENKAKADSTADKTSSQSSVYSKQKQTAFSAARAAYEKENGIKTQPAASSPKTEQQKHTAFSAAHPKGGTAPSASGITTVKGDIFSRTYTPSQLEDLRKSAQRGDNTAVCRYCAYIIKNRDFMDDDYLDMMDRLYKALQDDCTEAFYVFGISALVAKHDDEGYEALQLAAGRGYDDAIHYCIMLREQKKINVSAREYYKWLEKLAESTKETAENRIKYQYMCGVGYLEGKDMAKDIKRAIYWLEKASQNGSTDAMYDLVYIYQAEPYFIDETKALYWAEKAANAGHAGAMAVTGTLYMRGAGTKGDNSKAFYWVQKAAQKEYPHGYYLLGLFYAAGIGVSKDMTKAKEWMKKAKNSGKAEVVKAVKDFEKDYNITL